MTKFIDCSQEAKETKKETVFTHEFKKTGLEDSEAEPKRYKAVKYMGKCDVDGDIFIAYSKHNTIIQFKGIKGDEFD